MLCAILATLVLLTPTIQAMEPRKGANGKVRVLYTGDAISVNYLTPYMFMRIEPLVDATPVIASQVVASDSFGYQGPEMIKRAIRLYMPRTFRQLVDGTDVVILSDSTLFVFAASHIDWFARSVRDEGLALMMAGGHESYHMGGWQATVVADVLPVDCLPYTTGSGFAHILQLDNEFLSSIPWKGIGTIGFGGSNGVAVRPWATELAVFRIASGGENPMMVVGDVGKGRSFAFTPDWTFGWGEAFSRWEYYGDFCNNLMLYLAGQRVPQEMEILHAARKGLLNLDIARGLLISMFEFVERFGANPASIGEMLDEVDSLRREAEVLYIDQQFAESLEKTLEAIAAAGRAEEEAVRLKNSALFWVYLVEWLVVTATLLISGMAAWSLMVRRRYFREVRSTRFAG